MDVEKFQSIEFFSNTDCSLLDGTSMSSGPGLNQKDAQIYLASNSFYTSMAEITTQQTNTNTNIQEMNSLLNNTPASMRPMMCCTKKAGKHVFMNTRNNNFSNRDQKLEVYVS